MNPSLVIERKTTGWNHAMDMRMVQDVLPPGVQHAHKADVRAQMLGIGSDLQERGYTGTEQQVIEDPLIGQREW